MSTIVSFRVAEKQGHWERIFFWVLISDMPVQLSLSIHVDMIVNLRGTGIKIFPKGLGCVLNCAQRQHLFSTTHGVILLPLDQVRTPPAILSSRLYYPIHKGGNLTPRGTVIVPLAKRWIGRSSREWVGIFRKDDPSQLSISRRCTGR